LTTTRITRETLSALPVRRYDGPVRLVATPQDLAAAMDDIRRQDLVGFDTETRPAFRPGERYRPSLIQLATANAVYLFQIQQHDFSATLREVLSSPSICKAGVSVRDDLIGLKEVLAFDEQAVIDLGAVAKRRGLAQTGVRNLAGMFLGIRITKGMKITNWAAPVLSPDQITYAATDAWACRELYLCFARLNMI
jgi:ribonuclease D